LLVQFFQAFFFALGFLLLGLFFLQAFFFLLLQPFAALVFLALTLAFFAFELLLAFFLFLFQALFLSLDGDVGFAGVWLCLPWWGRRGRDRRGFGRLGWGGGGAGGSTARGAACCGTADHSSACTAGMAARLGQCPPQVRAAIRMACASTASAMARRRAGGRGGANWSRSSWACMRGCEGGLAVSRPA
jgi:hypothetical protein